MLSRTLHLYQIHRLRVLCNIALFAISVLLSSSLRAQEVQPRIHAGWGTNMLTSPGTELQSTPGRSGYFGAGVTIGNNESRVTFHPAITYHSSAYRTRMRYRVHFVSRRSAVDLDLLLGFPQMNRTSLITGGFIGTVTSSSVFVEQEGRDVVQGLSRPFLQTDHHAQKTRAGVVLGLSIPLNNSGRLVLDLRLRQHIIPLVEQDQSFALVFESAEQVLAESTRATELTVGLSFRLNKPAE